jgi:D-arabinose 1-dehydrogenase-like Zn-dependent alcohol dehydrogenase
MDNFAPMLCGLLLIFLGLAMAGTRAGYWLFVVTFKAVAMSALIAFAVVWWIR